MSISRIVQTHNWRHWAVGVTHFAMIGILLAACLMIAGKQATRIDQAQSLLTSMRAMKEQLFVCGPLFLIVLIGLALAYANHDENRLALWLRLAPLIGFLGTVLGIMMQGNDLLQMVATQPGEARMADYIQGVITPMFTAMGSTAFGLCISLTGILAFCLCGQSNSDPEERANLRPDRVSQSTLSSPHATQED